MPGRKAASLPAAVNAADGGLVERAHARSDLVRELPDLLVWPRACTPSSTGSRHRRRQAARRRQPPRSRRPDVLAFTSFPKEIWRQIWSNNPSERLNRRDPPPHRCRRHLPRPRRH